MTAVSFGTTNPVYDGSLSACTRATISSRSFESKWIAVLGLARHVVFEPLRVDDSRISVVFGRSVIRRRSSFDGTARTYPCWTRGLPLSQRIMTPDTRTCHTESYVTHTAPHRAGATDASVAPACVVHLRAQGAGRSSSYLGSDCVIGNGGDRAGPAARTSAGSSGCGG